MRRCSLNRGLIVGGCLLLLVFKYMYFKRTEEQLNTIQKREDLMVTFQLDQFGKQNDNLSSEKFTDRLPMTDKTFITPEVTTKSEIILPLTLTGDYIFNNPDLCSGTDNLIALVMVHTAPGHFERRNNIRSTYGSRVLFQNKIRVLFLLGTVKSDFLRDAMLQEHRKYRDTVQGNFIDSYHNLTHKGVMGFRWITEHCSHVKYVIKVDDDAVFDMWRFLRFFERKKHGGKSILCRVIYRPKIERTGKWEVDKNIFQNITRWTFNYCPGFVVILTGDVIAPLFKAAHTTPFLWIDDVYLFGLLPHTAGNMRIYEMPRTIRVTSYEEGTNCLRKKGKDCDYLAVAIGYKETDFHLFWDLIKKRNGIK